MSESAIVVSVVVIGRNEGSRLERCLSSVVEMDCEGFKTQIIYVDSASSDNSVEVANSFGAMTITLNALYPTAALARNAGWRLAKGKFVMFLDGDTVLHPRFVVESLADFGVKTAIVWGHRRELYPRASIYHCVLDLDWIYIPGESAFCGGDALFCRDALERTTGFDANLIAGEEPELCRRMLELGYVIQHVDRAMTSHDLGISRFSQYWRRAMRAGHAYAEVSSRFAASPNPFWRQECRSNQFRALALCLASISAILAAILLERFWPLAAWSTGLCVLACRTAWKARWKATSWAVLLLYGFHSLLQQLPIYLGQLHYRLNRQKGRRTDLVEYKGNS